MVTGVVHVPRTESLQEALNAVENAGVHQLTIETRTPAFRALRMGHDPVGITCTTLSNLEGPLWEIRDNRKHWPAAFIQD